MWIDNQYPRLAEEGYTITSDLDEDYNCIAYAAGDKTTWWSHEDGYHWPNASRTPTINSLIEVFEAIGFEQCANASHEPGFEKVALYQKNGDWKHASMQLQDGAWSSKLGPDEDIRHETPESVSGESYGAVHCIMRRSRAAISQEEPQP